MAYLINASSWKNQVFFTLAPSFASTRLSFFEPSTKPVCSQKQSRALIFTTQTISLSGNFDQNNDRPSGKPTTSDQDRVESLKSGLVSALGGSLLSVPVTLALSKLYYEGLTPSWELSTDMLALSLFFFGVVYRYTVRLDQSSMLKQGVVGAFSVVRAASQLHVQTGRDLCDSVPLRCVNADTSIELYQKVEMIGLGYFSGGMIIEGLVSFFQSLVAFGIAAAILEVAFDKGWIRKMDRFEGN